MKKITWFLTTALVIFFSSCATTNYMLIDIMKPATVSFPPNVVNLAFVDNSGMQPDTVNHITTTPNSLQHVALERPDSSKIVFKEAFVQFMNEENYFNKVELYPHNIRTDDDYDRTNLLEGSEVKEICEQVDADALVSLDMYIVSTDLRAELYDIQFFNKMIELKAVIGISARIYDKNGKLVIQRPVIQIDSTFWNNMYVKIPEREDALKELALISAEKFTKQFIPYWEKQERWYFSDGTSLMKEAAKKVKEGQWREAAVIWGAKFEEEKKAVNKAKIASNIALANECLDDIENAVKWIDIAYELLPEKEQSEVRSLTMIYRGKLKVREKYVSVLKEQLGTDEESVGE